MLSTTSPLFTLFFSLQLVPGTRLLLSSVLGVFLTIVGASCISLEDADHGPKNTIEGECQQVLFIIIGNFLNLTYSLSHRRHCRACVGSALWLIFAIAEGSGEERCTHGHFSIFRSESLGRESV